jgi:hypothetical protein
MKLFYLILLAPLIAHAGVYKCGNKYQSTPCDGAKVVQIREQTEDQKAAAAERLQQIRSEYEATKQQRAEAEEKEFERNVKLSELQASQQNALQQGRQADALERQADTPQTFIVPKGYVPTSPLNK